MPPKRGLRGYRRSSTLLEPSQPRRPTRERTQAVSRRIISKGTHSGDSSSPDPIDALSHPIESDPESPQKQPATYLKKERTRSDLFTRSRRRPARTSEDRRHDLDRALKRLTHKEGSSESSSTSSRPGTPSTGDRSESIRDQENDIEEEDEWAIFKIDKSKQKAPKRTKPDYTVIPPSDFTVRVTPHPSAHPFAISPVRRSFETIMVSPPQSDTAFDESVHDPREVVENRGMPAPSSAVGDSLDSTVEDLLRASEPGDSLAASMEQEKEEKEEIKDAKEVVESAPPPASDPEPVNDVASGTTLPAVSSTSVEDRSLEGAPENTSSPPIADPGKIPSPDLPDEATPSAMTAEQPDVSNQDVLGPGPASPEKTSAAEEGAVTVVDEATIGEHGTSSVVNPVAEPTLAEDGSSSFVESVAEPVPESQKSDAIPADLEAQMPERINETPKEGPALGPSADAMDVDPPLLAATSSLPVLTSSPAVEEGEEELDEDHRQRQSSGIIEEKGDVDADVDMEDASATAATAPTPSDGGTPRVKGNPGPKKKTPGAPNAKQAKAGTASAAKKTTKTTKAKTKVDDLKPAAKKSKVSRDTPDSIGGTSVSAASAEMARQDSDRVYCVCRKKESEDDDEVTMVGCESCDDWFHPGCVGLTEEQVANLDVYICRSCERTTKQKTIFKKNCIRDGCEKGLGGRESKFCSDLCAYKHHKAFADAFTNKKTLKQITAAFAGYPKPSPVQFIQHATVDLRPIPTSEPTPASTTASAPEHDALTVVQSQITAISSALELVRKRQEILRQAIDHSESLGPVMLAIEETRSGKSKRKGGPTEDKQCAWDPRLVLSDDDLRATDINEGGDQAADQGDGVCELGKRRCDRHSGWQKTTSLSLDLEEQQLARSHESLLEQQESMIKSAENAKEGERARTAFRDRLAVKRRA